MAGSSIRIDIDDRQVQGALERLHRAGGSLRPALAEIGEYLDLATRDRFDAERGPDGSQWAPLTPAYRARKRRNPERILVRDGLLRDLLRYHATDDSLGFGTDRIYGATHQFGRPEAGIPARPFLGFSEEDERAVADILQEHLENTLRE